MNARAFALTVMGTFSLWTAGCGAEGEPAGDRGQIAVAIAPITLSGVTNACYTLTVTNGLGQVVWTRAGVCADGYGDGSGSVSYVGPCDADAGAASNTVALVLESLHDASGVIAPSSYQSPTAAGALTRTFTCVRDADVAVDFNLTVLRQANQGFFDIAVTFEDLFCSAKLDCVDGAGQPLRLLHRPSGGRGETAVLAFACTGGAGSSTVLYLSDVTVSCGATTTRVDPTLGPGNLSAVAGSGIPSAALFEAAVYRGVEQLGTYDKRYWNVALGLDAVDGCTVSATATASDGAFTDGWTPADTTWPFITYAGAFDTCTRHALNGGDGVVTTAYTGLAGRQFPHFFSATTLGSTASWWNGAWSTQRALAIQAGPTALAADSTFTLTFDHAALVAQGLSLASGDDVRLLHWNGASFDELDRFAVSAWNTAATSVVFSPAAPIAAGATDADYVLAYGNPAAAAPPADRRAIYLLWEDFADGDFTTGNVWTANFGSWSVTGGYARLVNPTGSNHYEAGLYYPAGAAWTDIEVTMRLRDASTAGQSYPGPMLRVSNPAVGNTTLWWFEYSRATADATMRPSINNTDHNWTYNVTLPTTFPSNAWVDLRYRVVGQQIWSWFQGTPLHVGTAVSGTHAIAAGSIALGAHSNYPATQEFHYDDIAVWKHLPSPPTLTLGAIYTRP